MSSSHESYSCLAACGRLIQAVLFPPEMYMDEFHWIADSEQPFRLLDLPIEIRLMIYERLQIIHTPAKIPLVEHTSTFFGVLVNTTLEGVSILATCRQLKEEAGRILYPKLARMLRMLPTIKLEAEDMIAMTGGRSFCLPRNILQIIVDTLRDEIGMPTIHGYHRGRFRIWTVRLTFRLHRIWSDDAVDALVKFLIRIEKRIDSGYTSPTGYPPIALVISKPSSWMAYTIYPHRNWMKTMIRFVFRQQRPQRAIIHAPFHLLLDTVAYRAARLYRSRMTPQLSVTIMLDFPDVQNEVTRQWMAESYRSYVEAGSGRRSGNVRRHNLVEFGGLWEGLEE